MRGISNSSRRHASRRNRHVGDKLASGVFTQPCYVTYASHDYFQRLDSIQLSPGMWFGVIEGGKLSYLKNLPDSGYIITKAQFTIIYNKLFKELLTVEDVTQNLQMVWDAIDALLFEASALAASTDIEAIEEYIQALQLNIELYHDYVAILEDMESLGSSLWMRD